MIELMPVHDTLQIVGTFQSSVAGRNEAETLIDQLENLLNRVIESPVSIPLRTLSGKLIVPQRMQKKVSDANEKDKKAVSSNEWIEKIGPLVASVASVPNISMTASIFRMGIDSLGVIKLSNAFKKQLGLAISFQDIMQHPTVSKLADLCETRESKRGETGSNQPRIPAIRSRINKLDTEVRSSVCQQLGIVSSDIEGLYPCTSSQAAMVARTIQEPRAYYNAFTYVLHETVDVAKLKEAWISVMRKSDILRTSFIPVDHLEYPFVQVVLKNVKLDWIDVFVPSDTKVSLPDIVIRETEESLAKLSGNISNCISLKLIRSPSNSSVLILVLHHGLYDAWGLQLILDDVVRSYHNLSIIERPPYIDAVSEIITFQSRVNEVEQKHFWTTYLQSVAIHTFADLSETTNKTENVGVFDLKCGIPLAELERLCRGLDTTLMTVGQASWAKILSAYLGQDDVTFGNVLSGRNFDTLVDLKSVSGPCLTTVPCRVRMDIVSNREFITRVHLDNIEILKMQHTPLRNIQHWLNIRDFKRGLFDTIFLYQINGMMESIVSILEFYLSQDYRLIVV
jgi:aryl carrier-like protein